MKYLIQIPIVLLLASCASSKKIEISANPDGAEVFISDKFLGEYKSVGKTPMTLDLSKNKVDGRFVHLSVKAEGHDDYNLVLPKKYASGKVKLKLNALTENTDRGLASDSNLEGQLEAMKYSHQREIQSLNDQLKMSRMLAMNQKSIFDKEQRRVKKEMEEEAKENMQNIFNKTFEIQNALQNKRLSKAGKALAELKGMNPPETLFLTLEGNFEFLNGRRAKALASYRRALKIDPSNLELITIVRKLERALKG